MSLSLWRGKRLVGRTENLNLGESAKQTTCGKFTALGMIEHTHPPFRAIGFLHVPHEVLGTRHVVKGPQRSIFVSMLLGIDGQTIDSTAIRSTS